MGVCCVCNEACCCCPKEQTGPLITEETKETNRCQEDEKMKDAAVECAAVPNSLVFVGAKLVESRRWRCKSTKGKVPKPDVKPPLSHPIGRSFGTFNIYDFLPVETGSQIEGTSYANAKALAVQGYATALIAFGGIYIDPEEEWNSHFLNRVLQEGRNHVQNLLKEHSEDLLEVEQVPRSFNFCGNAMEIGVSLPIIVGTMKAPNPRVYSLKVGLCMFMRKYRYCLLRVDDQFYLIWRKRPAYFLFDCYGRGPNCFRDPVNGSVALMCVCNIDGIDALLTHMSRIGSESIYTLYEIRMTRLTPCCEQPLVRRGSDRKPDFEMVSENHAILQGSYHIATSCFKESRFKQAVAMGLISIIYSKIDPPCTWDASIVDKILFKGDQCYKEWTQFNAEMCLGIADIPRKVSLGQFLANIVIFPIAVCGNWINMPDYEACEITGAIRNFFENRNCSNLLIQVDRRGYAIWKRHDFYYLFDPYPRNILLATKYGERKNATLHMFNNLKQLCCVFTQNIIDISLPCKFFIHVVKILDLKKVNFQSLPEDTAGSCVNDQYTMDVQETESLNESIYDIRCEQAFECAVDEFDIGYCDLDAPPISETQNPPETEKVILSESSLTSEDEDFREGEEEGEEMEEEEQEEEEEKEDESEESEGEDTPKKKPKGRKPGMKRAKGKRVTKASDTSDEDEDMRAEKKGINKGKNKKPGKKRDRGKKSTKPSDTSDEDEDVRAKGKGGHKGKNKKQDKKKGKRKGEDDCDGGPCSSSDDDQKSGKSKNKGGKGKSKKSRKDKDDEGDKDKKLGKGESKGKDKNKGKDKDKKTDKDKEKDKSEKKDADKKKGKDENKDKKSGKSTAASSAGEGKSGEDGGKKKHKGKGKEKEKGKGKNKGEDTGKGKAKGKDKRGDESKKKGKDKGKDKAMDKQKRPSEGEDKNKRSEKSETSSETRSIISEGLSIPSHESKCKFPQGTGCIPNSYPGYTHIPHNLAVVGSESGSYQSLCQLIRTALQVADRVLTMTPWGNYVVFRSKDIYLLYDGCTCNPCRFRNIDLEIGTAGLLCFTSLHNLLMEVLKGRNRPLADSMRLPTVDEICAKYY